MIGVDIVEIPRFGLALARVPRIEDRLFTPAERSYCRSAGDPVTRLAGTFAAKEAVVKALGLTSIHQWAHRVEIVRDESGRPGAVVDGHRGRVAISISHEATTAIAIALQRG